MQAVNQNNLDGEQNPESATNSTERLKQASDRQTPAEVLALLSEDNDDQVRLLVAKNPATPHHVAAKLARDNSLVVRRGLATDRSCPVEILSVLAEDTDATVREVAKRTRRSLLATYQHIFNVALT